MMDMMNLPHTWTDPVSSRGDILFSFQVQDQTYGFYLFNHLIWAELIMFVVAESLLAALIGAIVYHAAVKQARTTTAYLVGFGFILPFWVLVPQEAMRALGVENKLFLFCTTFIIPTVTFFRTTQAMFGFTPRHAQQSVGAYALFYGSPMLLLWDEKSQKHVKADFNRILWHLGRFVMFMFLTGMYQSLSSIFPSVLPPIGGERPDDLYDLADIWNPTIWKDTLYFAVLFQLYLSTFAEGLILATTIILGRQTHMMMENPMFESKSPSEFWGRRWNLLVHECLKNGVYKPIRYMGGSSLLAMLGAFTFSGLLHEWMLPVVFYEHDFIFGPTTMFFLWQFMLIALEHSPVARGDMAASLLKQLSKWPTPLRSALVVLVGIPLGHWFVDIYVHSTYFLLGHAVMFSVLPL